jgi:hypothetical protein
MHTSATSTPQQQDDERAEADSVSETSSSGSGDDMAERDQAARHAERDERLDWMTLAFYLRLIQYQLTDEIFR